MPAQTSNQRVVITRYGDASVLKVITEPVPVPRADEVRIRVEVAGVSFGDVLQRTGLFYAGAPKMPYTPGYDVVGIVDAVGASVRDIQVGERVAALTFFGGYAQFVCAPAAFVVGNVPPHLDAAQTVSLVLNYTTAFQLLRRVAKLRNGSRILVYGGSGGVGTAMLDLARQMRLCVAAAISKHWHDRFRNSAEFIFDEQDSHGVAQLRTFQPSGFDAVFDAIGGAHVWRSRSFVAEGGQLIAFGIASAVKPGGQRNRMDVLRLGLLLAYAKFRPHPPVTLYAIDQRVKTYRAEINDDVRALIRMLDHGEIHPQVGAKFSLTDAAQAHELLESRRNTGKIVLLP